MSIVRRPWRATLTGPHGEIEVIEIWVNGNVHAAFDRAKVVRDITKWPRGLWTVTQVIPGEGGSDGDESAASR